VNATANPIAELRAELHLAATRRVAARRRRFLILLGIFAVGVVTASLSVAATKAGWLTGEPAPPSVVSGFKQYTPQLGFHPEAGKAQFVAQDGPIKLYATTNREGGICYLVDEPWKPANAGDGGTCASAAQAAVPISAGLLGGSASMWVMGGRIANERARSVRFTLPFGDAIVRPLGAGGFYVAQIPLETQAGGGHCPAKGWSPIFIALGQNGEKLGEWRIPVLKSDVDAQGRVVACGGSVTPIGPRGEQPSG
jgi:hypothetical protein